MGEIDKLCTIHTNPKRIIKARNMDQKIIIMIQWCRVLTKGFTDSGSLRIFNILTLRCGNTN